MQVERLALREVGLERVEAARGPQALEQLLGRACPRRRRRARAPRAPRRRSARCPRPRRSAASTASRRSRARRRLAVLGDDLVLGRGRRSAGTSRARCPGARASGASGPTARARAPRQRARAPRSSRRRRRRRARPRGTRPRSARSSRLGEALADVLAQLVERVEAGLGGEVVVELGQLLGLDLLDRDGELGLLAGELLGAVVVGEGDLDRALLAGRRRPSSCSSKPGTSRPEPSSTIWSRPSPPANGSPSSVPSEVHDHEVAASAAARSTVSSLRRALAQPLDLARRSPRRRPRARACRPRGPCTRRAWPSGGRRSRSRSAAARPRPGRSPRSRSGSPTGTIVGVVDRGRVPAGRSTRGPPRRARPRGRRAG